MKANLIKQYCEINKEKEHAIDSYLKYKLNQEKQKREIILNIKGGIIKKEFYERHFLDKIEGINPNVIKKINSVNKSNRGKVEKYINNRISMSTGTMVHWC